MHILFLNAGNETGGGMYHILRVMGQLQGREEATYTLGLFEKKELYERATNQGISTVHFPHRAKWSVHLLRSVIHYIKENNVTIVHTHGPRANVYMQMIKAYVNVKWILTVHSDPIVDFKGKGMLGRVLSTIHLRAMRSADKLISVCDAFHPLLIRHRLKKDKICTIHNGIEFSTDDNEVNVKQERIKRGFKEDDFLFIQVARLEEVKGHELAFIALKNLLQKCDKKQYHLLLIGDGVLKQQLEQFAKDLQIDRHVHFYGNQTDVSSFYQIANVTLLTSYSESFPYVWLESASFKKPIITTSVGDAAYLVKQNENGWKVKINDIDGLVSAMEEAGRLSQTNELMQRGESLYTYARQHFSLKHCTNKLSEVYEEVLLENKMQ